MPLTVMLSIVLPLYDPTRRTVMPMMSLLFASTTEPPTPCQLQAAACKCGKMSLCTSSTVAENGAFGVLVAVGVMVAGVKENNVAEGIGVNVGASVAVGDRIGVGCGVQVASSPKGVMVGVGDWYAVTTTGGNGFIGEDGLIKIIPK